MVAKPDATVLTQFLNLCLDLSLRPHYRGASTSPLCNPTVCILPSTYSKLITNILYITWVTARSLSLRFTLWSPVIRRTLSGHAGIIARACAQLWRETVGFMSHQVSFLGQISLPAVHFYGRSYFPFPFEWIKKGLLLSIYAKVLKSISINKDILSTSG